MKYWKWKMGLLILLGGAAIIFGFMLLWNALMPGIFGLPEISVLQGVGLLLLSRLLFGSWGGKKGYHGNRKKWWMHKMKHKWQHMSPEQREKFRDHWGWGMEEEANIEEVKKD
ncbi:MAG: hypothetical protein KI790_19160 [Cyclobacteriaceae bacterium]|nr:hypothetical protein [Cyclobacteriaceae bacterium HetDA_MAG_MS6]